MCVCVCVIFLALQLTVVNCVDPCVHVCVCMCSEISDMYTGCYIGLSLVSDSATLVQPVFYQYYNVHSAVVSSNGFSHLLC